VQTRVYLALAKLGQATVTTISKTAQLDRSEVYRGSSELQKLGLVEKILSTPNILKSIPLREGLAILMKCKTDEYNEIKTKTAEFIRKSEGHKNAKTFQEENQFVIIPEKAVALRRWTKATENAQKSLDYIIRWEGFVEGITQRSEHIKKLLEKGIKIRGIVSEPKNQRAALRIITNLKTKGSYNVRCILTQPPAVFSIIDKKELLFNIVTTPLPRDTPSLWSNNPCIVAVVQEYFELKWRTAERFPKKEQLHHESLYEAKSA